jgi:hypothetical protein
MFKIEEAVWLVSISGAVLLKMEGKRWRINLMSVGRGSDIQFAGVATLATKGLGSEQHSQASGPLAQVYRKPKRLY